jgi:hypothetical protein
MALMLLHEWELRPEPEEDGPPRRDPIDWRAQRWALVAALLFLAGIVVGSGTLRLALMWLALVVVVRRGWRALDGVGGLSEHRQ